ncbi:MAG: serine hydroxymethyltransferase [Thermoplasmata archaeon]
MTRENIAALIQKHEKIREEGLNLVASENWLSQQVKKALASDLAGRYHSNYYGGTMYTQELITTVEELAKELFDVKHALVTPLSGNICDLTVLFSFTDVDDRVAILPFTAGGYPLGLEKFQRKRVSFPNTPGTFDIDVPRCENLFQQPVALNVLGSSYIPFPHPVKEISELNPEGLTVYDGSHILGLLACGEFQRPLKEGAEILIGSTHKSFYGPQGGIILTDSYEHAEAMRFYLDVDENTGIGFVDNPHPNRIAALGAAVEEMLDHQDYGKNIVANSKALGRALDELGIPIRFSSRDYSESHQLFFDIPAEKGPFLCQLLEEEGIFIDVSGRFGTSEVTHRGMTPEDMDEIAHKIADAFPSNLRA